MSDFGEDEELVFAFEDGINFFSAADTISDASEDEEDGETFEYCIPLRTVRSPRTAGSYGCKAVAPASSIRSMVWPSSDRQTPWWRCWSDMPANAGGRMTRSQRCRSLTWRAPRPRDCAPKAPLLSRLSSRVWCASHGSHRSHLSWRWRAPSRTTSFSRSTGLGTPRCQAAWAKTSPNRACRRWQRSR